MGLSVLPSPRSEHNITNRVSDGDGLQQGEDRGGGRGAARDEETAELCGRSEEKTERGSSYWRAPSVWPGSQPRSELTFHRGRSSSTARTTRVEPRLPG